jgi:hypothetical protein
MRTRNYRLTVIGCALSWLLLGLHLPTAHELLDHGWSPPTAVVVMIGVLVVAAVSALWALLRAPSLPSA